MSFPPLFISSFCCKCGGLEKLSIRLRSLQRGQLERAPLPRTAPGGRGEESGTGWCRSVAQAARTAPRARVGPGQGAAPSRPLCRGVNSSFRAVGRSVGLHPVKCSGTCSLASGICCSSPVSLPFPLLVTVLSFRLCSPWSQVFS